MKEIALAEEVKRILSSSEQRKRRYISDLKWLNTREDLWKSDRIRVGVMGVTSSGKSTLINALLGDDLLTVAVRPSSSQLVSCSYAKERSVTVRFLNDDREIKIGDSIHLKDLIVQYSDESFNKQNEKKVAELELSTPNFDLGEDVLLIDSPGLDASGYEAHEKLTLENLLPTVDVVIFVTSFKSEVDRKMKQTLDTISKYNCPVMIVQNMLDSVRPSVDGRKSAAEVANDRMKRVRLAVEQSKIKNKHEVKISQISAEMAKKYRCGKKISEEEFKRSQYESFVYNVNELVKSKRPEIERQRVKTILGHIEELIQQEDKRAQNISEDIHVDNTLYDISNQVSVALDETYNNINSVILELQKIYDKYFTDNNTTKKENNVDSLNGIVSFLFSFFKDKLGEKEIKEIKQTVKLFESKVIQSVSEFSSKCSEVIKKLNLPARDLWSYNGLPRMPEVEIKTKIVENSRIVNKSGFGNLLLRGLSNRKWGTKIEHYTETVIDNEATRDSARRYIERLQFEYGKTLESWHKNALSTVSSIQQEINLRIIAFREKEQQALNAADWKLIREDLIKCILKCIESYDDGIEAIHSSPDPKPMEQKRELQDNTKYIKVPPKFGQLYDAAEKYMSAIQLASLEYAVHCKEKTDLPTLVVSNSSDNLSDFLYIFYKIPKCDFESERVYTLSDKFMVACAPTAIQLQSVIKGASGINVFLLINGLQFHTKFETSLRHSVQSNLGQKDNLYLVIQDFEILANGNGITECIRNIRSEIEPYKGLVLISHKNPAYNIAMIHAQTTVGKLKEETMFHTLLTDKFPFLVNGVVKKRINNILRA